MPSYSILSGEAANTNFIVFSLTDMDSNPQSIALEASMLTITLMQSFFNCLFMAGWSSTKIVLT
jgi:hypothetical protein